MELNKKIPQNRDRTMDTISTGILEILRQGDHYTAAQLGKILSVSERTIRNRIKEVNEQIIEHGAVIISERGAGDRAGFHLDMIDPDGFSSWMELLHKQKNQVPNSSEERVSYIIDYLLNQKEYVLIDDLCDMIYVSHNTLSSDLKKAEQILRSYNLVIDRKPNYGIRVLGTEIDKRICIIDYFSKNEQYSLDPIRKESMLMVIGDTLSSLFHQSEYMTSVESYQAIKNVIYVSYVRKASGFMLHYSEEEKEELREKISFKMQNMVDKAMIDLKEDFGILNDEDEKLFIAMQIAGRGNIDVDVLPESDLNVDLLIQNMLNELKEGLNVDLTDDLNLMLSLKHHMIAMDIRMRYHIQIGNPILDMVKKQYSFAYALASYSCSYLSEYYDKPIREEEIGYIAIIYALALEQKISPKRKKNVVIVCAAGNSSSRFFMYKYKETFSDYLENVYECSANDIENFDFAGKKIDFCFKTINIEIDVPVPCYTISLFPSEAEVRHYKELFSNMDRDELLNYYDPDLFISHLDCQNKEEAIFKMVDKIKEKYELPSDFEELVMQREKYGMTSFGTLAAMPHPNKTCTKDNIVCVAITDEPIDWGQNNVQVIILLSLSTDKNQDYSAFIQATTELISRNECLEQLIKKRNFDSLMDMLIRDHA